MKKIRYQHLRYASTPIWRRTTLRTLFLRMRHLAPNNVLPPLKLLNEIFRQGSSSASNGDHLNWQPFVLRKTEYAEFEESLKKYFGAAPVERGKGTFSAWHEIECRKAAKRKEILKLKVGSRIRVISVPKEDMRTAARERAAGLKDAGWTAKILRKIANQKMVVKIHTIDEYGNPWYAANVKGDTGKIEEHWIAVMENESWKLIK